MKKNRRWICFDVWMDIFPHFDRPQLGLKLALISPRFNALVVKHFDGQSELTIWRPIRIAKMGIKAKVFVEKSNGKTVQFPMPDYPMHNKIRFENLQIEYIDHSVIAFLRANQQIWDKGTNLDLNVPPFSCNSKDVQPIWNVFVAEIWPIFAPNIRHLTFPDGVHLYILRRHASPSFLSNFNIISINSGNVFPDAIADDGPKANAFQALSKWLHTPTKDGQPKQLSCRALTSRRNKFVNDFKKAFLRATIPSASYIIRIEYFKPKQIGQFELTNERTNEVLTSEKEEKDDENVDEYDEDDDDEYTNCDWLLKRCPIGKTIQWEDKKTDKLSNIDFRFYSGTNCIGPLSPPKAGQKNAKSHLKMNPGPSGQQKK